MRAVGASALVVALILASPSGRAQAADATGEALALEQQGKNVEAEAAWRAVLKTHPASAEAYGHLGLLEAREQHYKEAVPLYRKALALEPAMPGLRLNLGLALFKSEQLKEAIQEFSLLKAKAPDSPEVQRLNILIGMAHYGLGDYAAAARFLKQAAAVDTQNLQLRLALAHSCLWSKQYQCVLDTYHEMLTLNAESAEADMLAGEAEDAMKNYNGAIAEFRAAAKVNPQEPEVHFGLGYILWTQHEYEEAAGSFRQSLPTIPTRCGRWCTWAIPRCSSIIRSWLRPCSRRLPGWTPSWNWHIWTWGFFMAMRVRTTMRCASSPRRRSWRRAT